MTKKMTGLRPGLPDDQYHASPGLSWSAMKVLVNRTPAHLHRAPEYGTPAKALGSLVHTMTLEPLEFSNRYVVHPEKVNRNTKAWKEAVAVNDEAGKILIQPDEFEEAQRVFEGIMENKVARELLEAEGMVETAAYATDPQTKLLTRMKCDKFVTGGPLIDLKTAADASPSEFARAIFKFGYHGQAAHYSQTWVDAEGPRPTDFMFIVVEKKPPYLTNVVCLPAQALNEGAAARRFALDVYKRCADSGQWPGYSEEGEILELDLPPWGYRFTEPDTIDRNATAPNDADDDEEEAEDWG